MAVGAVAVSVGALLAAPGAAQAASSYGTPGPAYSGVTHAPTSDKPQSKLWWNDGSWWAYMWVTNSGWHIERLDRATKAWVDTGVRVDTRSTTLADTLWDGHHLFIASEVSTVSTDGSPKSSLSGQPAKLYRYSYAGGKYTLDAGFPTQINNNSSESLTIDEDSTGVVWATWTQVKSTSTGYTNSVYTNASAVGGTSWGTPFVVPGSADVAPDDISAVVAYQSNKVGIMYSDQLHGTVWWAWRTDGTSKTAASSWHVVTARRGSHLADDHLDLKTLQADTSGRVFASVKTSLDENGGSTAQPQLQLLVYKPGTGAFSASDISTIADCQTRPQVVLDTSANLVRVFMTGPLNSVTYCRHAGTPGAIYEKSASLDDPVFGSGRGTPVIQDAASANMNNVTTSKQPVSSATGVVVLASNDTTKRYWSYDSRAGTAAPAPAAPVAGFSTSPSSPVAGSPVAFTDTSTGSPTSWAWTFGDGATSTAKSPSHTYTGAGTRTVTLKASNASGSSTATRTVSVAAATTSPPPSGSTSGAVSAGASTTAVSTAAVTGVSLARPSGTVAGDVLVASITTNAKPSMSAVPAGWSPVTTAVLSPNSDASVFAYYHVTTGTDPASWTWKLSSAQKWNAGMTDFHGVDTASPFDTAAVTHVNTGSSTSVSLASVTTVTPGAMVVAGVGLNSTSATVTAPSGWTEAWEGDGAQDAELAHKAMPAAGASGATAWRLSASATSATWVRALRPAAG